MKVKVKVSLQHIMKAQMGKRGDGGGWSAPRTGRFTPRKDPVPILCEAKWAPWPAWTGMENLTSPPGFDPRTVQPVASRYTD